MIYAIIATTDVDDDVCAKVGKIIILWAGLEHQMLSIIYRLLKVDEVTGRDQIGAKRIAKEFKILRDNLDDQAIAVSPNLDEMSCDIKELSTRRNWLGHGIWFRESDSTWNVRAASGKVDGELLRKHPKGIAITDQWCQETVDEIGALYEKLEQIDHEVTAKLSASQ